MTEEQYQEARKLMQKANYWRGRITAAKGEVGKWTRIEDCYRRDLKEGKADGAKKMLLKALNTLDKMREKFAAMKFPQDEISSKNWSSMVKQLDDEEFEMLIETTKRLK